jgi:hypothetical protein
VDERGIRAVLEQAPDEVRQQLVEVSDRRVDPARRRRFSSQRLVERFAHAEQALEFELRAAAGKLEDRRHGAAVVSGKRRIDRGLRFEQGPCAGKVGDIGRRLARVDGVIRHAEHLCALDLAVPVGALHQAHRESPARAARRGDKPVADRGARFW